MKKTALNLNKTALNALAAKTGAAAVTKDEVRWETPATVTKEEVRWETKA
ncbi:hypothetical protein ABIC83_002776 [Roseateles asaccharophilus]